MGGLALAAAAAVPCLARLWRDMGRRGELASSLAWASTLTWTMVLNLYAAAYDTPIILLGLLLMADGLYHTNRGALPLTFRILLVLLYVAPWSPPVPVGDGNVLQVYTMVLLALGIYQLWVALGGIGEPAAGNQDSPGVSSPQEA